MNKTELINAIAEKAGLTKVDAKNALDATIEAISEALAADDKVALIGFGTFSVAEKTARTGINPRTKEKIEIPVIFLTGHSDFTYARQAIIYGVSHYILKPVNEAEFIGVLGDLYEKLARQQREKMRQKAQNKKQQTARLIVESNFFSELFHYGFAPGREEEIREKAGEMGVNTDRDYRIAVFMIWRYRREDLPLEGRYRDLYAAGREAMGEQAGLTVICDLFDHSCIVFRECVHGEEERQDREFARMRELLAGRLSTQVHCGVSSRGRGTGQLVKTYKEAVSALNNTKIFAEDILAYETVARETESRYQVSAAKIRHVQACVGNCDKSGCETAVREIFSHMRESKCNYESILQNAQRLLLGISEACAVSGLELRWFMGEYRSLDAAFEHMASLGEVTAWFCRMTGDLIDSRSFRAGGERSLPVVQKACRYMQQHCGDADLTQAEVSRQMGVTAAYLSAVFKKDMGVSMTRYLTAIRLERARELLAGEGVEVHRAAELAGYSDEYYFSRCFKKYYGISPSQARRRKQEAAQPKIFTKTE